MVEACSFQPILAQVLEAFVQWMVWHSFHIFSVCEKLSAPSRVKGLYSSCVLHGSYGCALHCAENGSEAHVQTFELEHFLNSRFLLKYVWASQVFENITSYEIVSVYHFCFQKMYRTW